MSIENGTYEATPLPTAALGEAKTGTVCVGVEFEFTGSDGQNHRLPWYGYFTEKTEERTIESLRFCGWTGNDLADLSEIGQRDVKVSIVVENEEYEGKTRPKVQWVNRSGGLNLSNPLDETKRKAFAARMKGKILEFDQRKGAPAKPVSGQKTSDRAPF